MNRDAPRPAVRADPSTANNNPRLLADPEPPAGSPAAGACVVEDGVGWADGDG
jgi:hypothetical protein